MASCWRASCDQAITLLRELYVRKARNLPDPVAISLGSVWRDAIGGYDRERAFQAFEVATLSALRRSVRNGSIWITHSFAFGSRDQLFIPLDRWTTEARRHYARLALPAKASVFIESLVGRLRPALEAVANAARAGYSTLTTICTLAHWRPRRHAVVELRTSLSGALVKRSYLNSCWKSIRTCASAGSCSGASRVVRRNC